MTGRSKSLRLDQLLVSRGLFPSREKAKRAVMAGWVEVGGRRVDKPGTSVPSSAELRVRPGRDDFVSRAGHKLAAALDAFGVDPENRICLDIGASTGGFTDCLLRRGAARVYAVDVGRGQLDYSLRRDARVRVLEGVNARYLDSSDLPERGELATVDVSFISLVKVVPPVLDCLTPDADILVLIKPQFEAPRGSLGKGGILRDEELRREVIEQRARELARMGPVLCGVMDSPVTGAGGNREAFAHLRLEAAASTGMRRQTT